MDKEILIDNGVLRNVFVKARPDQGERFWRSVASQNYYDNRIAVMKSTPLMLIEILGIGLNEIDPAITDPAFKMQVADILAAATTTNHNETISALLELYKTRLAQDPCLNMDEISKKFGDVSANRCDLGQGILNAMFEHNLGDQKKHDLVLTILAGDRVQAIEFGDFINDKEVLKRIDLTFLAALHLTLADDRNLMAFARVTDQLWKRLMRLKSPNWQVPYEIEADGDGVDCDVVHYVICGTWRDGKKNAVAAFSKERLDGWRKRCFRYLAVIRYLNEQSEFVGKEFLLTPGLVFKVADNGELTGEVLDVAKEFDLKQFRLSQDGFLR